ncbi:MAG TPA: rod shape-determining protein MreD [Desulfomonilaceae bacterium]|nr:rod shape-determining protein MreD [Desulfomonilaceae bacterium]
MTDGIFMLFTGIAALVLQTTSLAFLAPIDYKPDMILILVAWATLRMPFGVAAGFAFTAGILIDLLSGAPTGLFALLYCLIFLTCGYCHATLHLEGRVAQAVIIFGLTLASGGIVLLMRWISGPVGFGWKAAQWFFFKSVFTGLTSMLVFPVLERLRSGYTRLVGA